MRATRIDDFRFWVAGWVAALMVFAAVGGEGGTSPGGRLANARAFGAVGDGAADDTRSVLAALAALKTTGGALYFPAGEYVFKETLIVARDNVTIYGDGADKTVLLFDREDGTAIRFDGGETGVSRLRLQDLTLRCGSIAKGVRTSGAGVHVGKRVGDYAIANARIVNGYWAVWLEEAYSGFIENAVIDGTLPGASRKGVVIDIAINTHFANVSARCEDTGWEINGGVDTLTARGCEVRGTAFGSPRFGTRFINTHSEAEARHDPRWIRVDSCRAEVGADGTAFALEKGYGNAFTDCVVNGGGEAFRFSGAHDIGVFGGTFADCRRNGVVLEAAVNVLLDGISVSGCSAAEPGGHSGILMAPLAAGAVRETRVIGCRVGGGASGAGQKYGIETRAGTTGYILVGNDLRGNVLGGSRDEGGDVPKVVADNIEGVDAVSETAFGPATNGFADTGPAVTADVKAFGAVGDGVTDDTRSVLAALAGLAETGGRLRFPAGTYAFSQTLVVRADNIEFLGDGQGLTQLFFTRRNGTAVRVLGAKNFRASAFTLICFDRRGVRNGGYGIAIGDGAGDFVLDNLRIANGYVGLRLDGVRGGLTRQVTIDEYFGPETRAGGSRDGVVVSRSSDLRFENVDALVHRAGWEIDGEAERLEFLNCGTQKTVLTYNVGGKEKKDVLEPLYGFRVASSAQKPAKTIRVVNFYAETGDRGVAYALTGCRGAEFFNCYSAWGRETFNLKRVEDVTIRGGVFFGCARSGVRLRDGKNVSLLGVSLTDRGREGGRRDDAIAVASGVSGLTISGCRVGGTSLGVGENAPWRHGVAIAAGVKGVTVVNNDLTGNAAGGVADKSVSPEKTIANNLPRPVENRGR